MDIGTGSGCIILSILKYCERFKLKESKPPARIKFSKVVLFASLRFILLAKSKIDLYSPFFLLKNHL